MNKLFIAILLLCSTMMLHAAKVDKKVTLTINNENREYWLYVPDNVKQNPALVISMHGASGHSTDKSPFRTSVADNEGCIVVYPQGNSIYFPVFGGTVTGWDASGEENTDVKFLKAVIEDVAKSYSIDRKRIYACGFSNGGMMTYALTNCCSEVFAAFASISGYPLNEFHLRHTAPRPVPFLHIHGKEDNFVLYSLMPVIVDEMVARLGANPVPQKTTSSGRYDKSVYEGVEGSFPYTYYEINGMGHNDFTDKTPEGNSAQTIWNFFKEYTLDSPYDTNHRWRPRIETTGYQPTAHGWTVNNGTTLLQFGGEQNDTGLPGNHNTYHSLQFTTGSYKLCFQSEGDATLTIGVKIQKLTGQKSTVLEATIQVGSAATLPFDITDGWGEYQITFTRPTSTADITVSNIGIYSRTEENHTGICATFNDDREPTNNNLYYDLQGRQVTNPQHGLFIKNGHKIFVAN